MRRRARKGWALAVCAAVLTLIAGPALAHDSFPGAEGFMRGLIHPLTEPLQGMALGALGLVIGFARSPWNGWALAGAALAACAGLALGALMAKGSPPPMAHALLTASLVAGLILAAAPRARAPLLGALAMGAAALAGPFIGYSALPEPGEGRLATALGSLAGALLFTTYVAGAGAWLMDKAETRPWLTLAPRIAGAWIAAAALMLLAFELRA